ncbi:HNH endonuclease signature motif containing protein [Micromonospora sp. CA-111912]|uniref:HNH endonuclease signature motif containing protein n=1 Tax=Micromonospora sp. CA-111912 TaxID=3239955 RepID=UPI003D8E277F
MARYKYSEALLRDLVAASHSIADVLRHLGLPQNGGSHAHLRRRIDAHGIDTSHFRRTGLRRASGPSSRSPDDLLVLRDPSRRRAHPDVLRRALASTGTPLLCADCGVGTCWNGRPLTLQVDHRNGRFWDCRRENLRLLCPNCHSQTPTYAGRNRRRFGVAPSDPAATDQANGSATARTVTTEELVELFRLVDRRELDAGEAARRAGCHPGYLHRLRQRLEEQGSVSRRQGGRRWRAAAVRETVLHHALANPTLGPKKLACLLRELPEGGCAVSHGTVSTILRAAALNTVAARRSRLSASAGVA